jgi:very-short-patch-repair endonuclease
MTPEQLLRPLLAVQDGAVTTRQAAAAGVTPRQWRSLQSNGWSQPARGVLIEPHPIDLFRAGFRAALLASPTGVGCRTTAGRVHRLWGFPQWTPQELPQLVLPSSQPRRQRQGMKLYFGLTPADEVQRSGLEVTSLACTINSLAYALSNGSLVCLLDSALRLGWTPDQLTTNRRRRSRLCAALALADARSESALETLLRLLLIEAGIAPEVLQHMIVTRDGTGYRLDFAWPSRMVAVEADGHEHHDKPDALYRDRVRQNKVVTSGWIVLRFTWYDVVHNPHWVISEVRAALQRPSFAGNRR